MTSRGVRVVEFNARLGDPEAQVLLMRLKSDLLDLLMAATDPLLQRVLAALRGFWSPPRFGSGGGRLRLIISAVPVNS